MPMNKETAYKLCSYYSKYVLWCKKKGDTVQLYKQCTAAQVYKTTQHLRLLQTKHTPQLYSNLTVMSRLLIVVVLSQKIEN